MHKILKIKWLYVLCAVLLIAFAVTFIPFLSIFTHSFETIAKITSSALFIVTAIIIALIAIFAVFKLCRACKNKK